MSDQNQKINEFLETMDLNEPAPAEEPARQFYFIKKARMLVAKQEAQLGRPLTFCVTTFGCQMNARDSEKLVRIFPDRACIEDHKIRLFFLCFFLVADLL